MTINPHDIPPILLCIAMVLFVVWVLGYMFWWFPHILRIQFIEEDVKDLKEKVNGLQRSRDWYRKRLAELEKEEEPTST